jgi:hypothetical protein
MNATLPSGRTGQIIAILLLLLLVTAVWRLVAVPVIDLYDLRSQELERQGLQAAHQKALADALPRLQATPGADAPSPMMTLAGNSDATAAATLQSSIQDMVGNAGVSLGSVEILPVGVEEGLRRIGLRVTLSGTSETVTRLLIAIEQAEPPILIDDLQIHGNVVPVPGNGAQALEANPKLDTSFAVYGFRQDQQTEQKP